MSVPLREGLAKAVAHLLNDPRVEIASCMISQNGWDASLVVKVYGQPQYSSYYAGGQIGSLDLLLQSLTREVTNATQGYLPGEEVKDGLERS